MSGQIPDEMLANAQAGLVYALWSVKQSLLDIPDVESAFDQYAALMDLQEHAMTLKRIKPILGASSTQSWHTREILPAGEPYSLPPARVVGPGNHRPLHGKARSVYLTCLRDVHVRSRSALFEFDREVLIDFEGDELARIDDQLDLDPAIFRANNEEAWVIESSAEPLRIPEAFSLIGTHTWAFGHWIWEYLPKYVVATMNGLPPVPVLIDAGMPDTHREVLTLLLPKGVPIIELPSLARAVVDRMWYSPSPMHMPFLEKMNERFCWDYLGSPAARFARIIAEMNRRIDVGFSTSETNGSPRIFLARKPSQHRKLVNYEEIENSAADRGFKTLFPQDVSFDAQLHAIRAAEFVVGPEGSAMFLGFFAMPGTKFCILNHPYTAGLAVLTALLEEIGHDVTVLSGPVTRDHESWPHFADYRIPEQSFGDFIDKWTAGERITAS